MAKRGHMDYKRGRGRMPEAREIGDAPDGFEAIGRQEWLGSLKGRGNTWRRYLMRYDAASRTWLKLEGPIPLPRLDPSLHPDIQKVLDPYRQQNRRQNL